LRHGTSIPTLSFSTAWSSRRVRRCEAEKLRLYQKK
jgi:hypothetical protein